MAEHAKAAAPVNVETSGPTSVEPEAPHVAQIALQVLKEAARTWTPPGVRRLVRRGLAEANARAMEKVPLPLYELMKMQSL
ncbi:MAG: hypothetical protein ACK4N5_22955, partial [Myxococcales bacterium]